jgi:hypothetical protein
MVIERNMVFIGFFHYFEDFSEYIKLIDYILINCSKITLGKFVILHNQISTKSGKIIGKKQEDSYIFSTIYNKEKDVEKFRNEGIINQDNFFKFKDIEDKEFGKFRNLKKATILGDYGELIEYAKKHNLE